MANPLFPGYYPGKPVYRDKRPWIKPEDVPMGAWEGSLNEIEEKVMESPLNFPRWLVQQEIDSIKAQASIAAFPKDPKIEQLYGAEDVEELPGASVSISFNPAKFFDDPGEYLKKTFITNPLKSITDPDELQSAARAAIIAEAVKDKSGSFSLVLDDTEVDLGTKSASFKTKMGKNYGSVGLAARDFSSNSSTSFFRNKEHDKFNEAMLSAVSDEMRLKGAWQSFGSNLDKSTADQINSAGNIVVTRSNVVSSMKSLEGSISKVGKNFDKSFFSPVGGDPTNEINALRAEIKKVESSINSLSKEDRALAGNAEKYISNLRGGLDRFVDSTGNIRDKKGLERFLRTEGAALYRNEFDRGIAGSLSAKLAYKTANDKNIQAALNAKDKNGKRVFSKASVNSLNLSRSLQVDHDFETLNDLYTDLSEGKLPTQFIWTRVIQPRIQKVTPSYWVGRGKTWFMENTKAGNFIQSSLNTYIGYWNSIQDRLIKKLPILGIAGQRQREILKRKIANMIAEAITKAIDLATEGIGLLFDRIIKVVVRFVVEKTADFLTKLGKALLKLDPEAIEELFIGAGKVLTPVAMGCLAPFVILFVLIMFLLILFLGVLPREDATKEYGPIGERIDTMLPWFGGYNAEDCKVDDSLVLPYDNNSTNAPAYEAFELVNKLKRGFWCYWNHHPDYDDSGDRIDLWDEIMFEFNAFPAALNECADCLFWCTWLPYVAYQNVGMDFDPTISYLGAQRMNDWFKSSQTYIEPGDACGSDGVESGDIVFWNVAAGSGWHVSMVYKVESGVVHTIHSNAPYKNLPLLCDGSSVNDPPGGAMTVVGFGRPN